MIVAKYEYIQSNGCTHYITVRDLNADMPTPKKLSVVEKDGSLMRLNSKYLKGELSKKLIQQENVIDRIIPYIVLNSANLNSKLRPIGTFLLLGNTGSGKTHTVEVLADILHEDETKLLKIDCGQYELGHEVAKLIGSPPGYLGHRETEPLFTQAKINGLMTGNRPAIILFDEIEKAHPSFYKTLLSILERGTISLGTNAIVDLTNTLIFMTSNLGAKQMQDVITPNMGFSSGTLLEGDISGKMKSIGLTAAKKKFSPEFINRIDEILTYEVLTETSIGKIFDISFNKARKLIETQGNFLFISEEVKKYLIKEGFSSIYGARELNRAIQRLLVQPFANLIVDKDMQKGTVIKASLVDGKVDLTVIDEAVVNSALGNL